jgi:hypothetical protein
LMLILQRLREFGHWLINESPRAGSVP